jgi:glycosyltransferase involved in cell wall biosynthesis
MAGRPAHTMSSGGRLPSYAVITPARNEAAHLDAAARSLMTQTHRPLEWVVVDDGSTDGTRAIAERLASEHDWIRTIVLPADHPRARGAPIVRAFQIGREALHHRPDITVKLDADLTLPDAYFEAIAATFAREPRAGIVGGVIYEQRGEEWRRGHISAHNVTGAAKAYRTECLEAIGGLHPAMGWDGIDEYAARARGWEVRVLEDLPIRHHRRRGARQRWYRARWEEGNAAHFMGYRPTFLAVRTAYRMIVEHPPVLGGLVLAAAYLDGRLRRRPQVDDPQARAALRAEQVRRLRGLLRGRRTPPITSAPALDGDLPADFTVIVCTRNRAVQLHETLDALLAQSFGDFRVVVVDQSEEPDPELATREAADARLAVIRDTGRGLSRARNVGARAAESEWLVFLDDDCLPEPDWARALRDEFASNPDVDFVACHVGALDLEDQPGALGAATFPVVERRRIAGRWVWPFEIGYGVCHAVRRSAADRLGGWDERLGPGVPEFPASDDMDFNYRFLRAGGTALVTPEPRAYHRQWRTPDAVVALYRGYMASWAAFAVKQLRSGDVLGGARLFLHGIRTTLRMFASAARHRSRLRLRVALARVRGLASGTVLAVRRRW